MTLDEYLSSDGRKATELARRLNVPDALLSQWRHKRRPTPVERCSDIEKATAGAVTCEELRPDKLDYWAFLRGSRSTNGASQSDTPNEQAA
ncbi:YdaS family helix-turn-helix protein [Aquamicrobium sp.]|uniref:transcriptional regulator n=1 Tax=Aquamicrobium sp. TaxID=1872579 RepID=UPI0025872941|nr:YdaS family helix-turn-helix protein [Aquamicrobium sp.]